MPDPPRLSGRALFDWLQAFGFLIVVVEILRSSDPLSFKLAVIGVPVVFLYTTVILRVGGGQERRRIKDHFERKRRERREAEHVEDLEEHGRRRYEDAA